jgi:Alkylmercury lyase
MCAFTGHVLSYTGSEGCLVPSQGPPPAQPTPSQAAILAAAFRVLVDPGTPATVAGLAEAAGCSREQVEADLAALAEAGRIQRTAGGEVKGCMGLTLESTSHTISINGALRHTWCALDAFGIMGALRASGWIDSVNKITGRGFHVDIDDGVPRDADPSWVVFILDQRPVSSVITEWCPLVNIFESAAAARSWAADQGVSGDSLSLADTASLGTKLWEPRINVRADS